MVSTGVLYVEGSHRRKKSEWVGLLGSRTDQGLRLQATAFSLAHQHAIDQTACQKSDTPTPKYISTGLFPLRTFRAVKSQTDTVEI